AREGKVDASWWGTPTGAGAAAANVVTGTAPPAAGAESLGECVFSDRAPCGRLTHIEKRRGGRAGVVRRQHPPGGTDLPIARELELFGAIPGLFDRRENPCGQRRVLRFLDPEYAANPRP